MPTPTPIPTPFSPEIPAAKARPLAEIDPAQRDGYFNTPPAMQIDAALDYIAILHTDVGDITIDLLEKQTPATVNNFVVLALNGFYDGLSFFQVVPQNIAVAGDPTASGRGGPGYQFDDEIVAELRHDTPGTVSMASVVANGNGSQFLITLAETPWLDDRLTIFGRVIEGMDVAEALPARDAGIATEAGATITAIDIETR